MTNSEYTPEQQAANTLRSKAVTQEEKDIAYAALKAAFPGLLPGTVIWNDGTTAI
jgi:hypothetical protein